MTMTFKDLMGGHPFAEIACAYTGMVVRRLVVIDDRVDIDALTEQVGVALDTEIRFEPWFMDRGSLVFRLELGTGKLCTDGDVIRFDDGTESAIDYASMSDD